MVKAKAHSNIALIKYWGKQDEFLFLPYTSSLSLTLDALYTITEVTLINQPKDVFILNDVLQNDDETVKISRFVDLFRKDNQKIQINSTNYFPTAAGLASSASGYAALSVALNETFHHHMDKIELSRLARRGSGSATRSLHGGFAIWQKGTDETSVSYPLESNLDIEMIIVVVNREKKKGSSRSLMKTVVNESAYFRAWVNENDSDLTKMKQAIENQDIHRVGRIAQRNAMMMHATLLAIDSPFFYLEPKSLEVIKMVQALQDQGIVAYYTMDAGPNVKIITNSKDRDMVVEACQQLVKDSQIIVSKPGPGAYLV